MVKSSATLQSRFQGIEFDSHLRLPITCYNEYFVKMHMIGRRSEEPKSKPYGK